MDYVEQWHKHGEEWKQLFDMILPYLQRLADTWDAELETFRWDAPDVTLIWQNPVLRMNYTIEILLMESDRTRTLRLSGGAWKEMEADGKRIRRWKWEPFDSVVVPDMPETAVLPLIESVKHIRELILRWTENMLQQSEELPLRETHVGRL